jgi:murein DD-endopeptidase MepM/ murein hydrolase activator NlpD
MKITLPEIGLKEIISDLKDFFQAYFAFFKSFLSGLFWQFEGVKNFIVGLLYRQRGKWARPFAHFSLALLLFIGISLSPQLERILQDDQWQENTYSPSSVLATYSLENQNALTIESSHGRGEIVTYVVKKGDTVSSIAQKFGVSIDTVIWANDLKSVTSIKPGDRLEIPPVTGVVHEVQRGETVYSVAKKYEANPQAIADFPFNTFANDETLALAVGQDLIIPGGVVSRSRSTQTTTPAPRRETQVTVASGGGNFIWPSSGRITQRYYWYHRAIDIANKNAPAIVAAQKGTVAAVVYGRYGYGNHVVIDHGNGYQTLYGHMSKIYVQSGASVAAGQSIGQMGTTGRSTGIHLHFEVIRNGAKLNPLSVLQ